MRQTAFQPAVDGSEAVTTDSVATEDVRSLLRDSGWLTVEVDELADEDDLYAAGLTSHGSVNLMLALEERFDIEFPEHLLRRRTFESIKAIQEAVAGILDGTAGP